MPKFAIGSGSTRFVNNALSKGLDVWILLKRNGTCHPMLLAHAGSDLL